MPKSTLRKALLARRLALSTLELSTAADAIQETFLAMPEYAAAVSVALYCAVNNEVSAEKVMHHALLAGKALFLPAVEGNSMFFRRLTDPEDLVPGRFGIKQPVAGSVAAKPEEIELIVVPGVGFDLSGQRIGYGKGYYDRALHRLEGKGMLTAFCYEFQLVESLAGEPHDVKMDRIITEQRLINTALLK
jgi:5-formyltetrahydrofolate cyclo-ligase